MGLPERVREIIEPALATSDTEVVDVELTHGLLRVTVDRPQGVDLEVVTDVTHQISELLDSEDPIKDSYTLEVSSPGLERPLRTPAHFERFVGTKINLKTKTPINDQRRFSGLLESADDNAVVVDGTTISYEQIERARTIYEWDSGGDQKQVKGKAS